GGRGGGGARAIGRQTQTSDGEEPIRAAADIEIRRIFIMALSCRSRRWLEHPDSGWLSAGRTHRQHQTIQFRDKQRGARAGNRCNASNATIGAVCRGKDIDESLSASDVDAMSLCIDEQVISIATDVWARDQAAVIHRKCAELRRIPESHENALRGLVKR